MTKRGTLRALLPALALCSASCALDESTADPESSGGQPAGGSAGRAGGGATGGSAGATSGGSTAAGGSTSGGSAGSGTSAGGSLSGGSAGTGGASAGSGGTSSGGLAGGGAMNGGAMNGGAMNGGAMNGGAMNGGAMNGGAAGSGAGTTSGGSAGAGGSAQGGTGGSASGGAGAGGTGGSNAGGTGGLMPGNPPERSAGCGKPTTVTNGKKTIRSTNQDRTYIIDIPSNYDMDRPYRLFYTSHWIGSTSEAVRDQDYYFLKPLANAANEPAIFVAPQSDGATWQQKDHALFDDILAYVKENLCIDTTRIFATGFSFGGMITYSLSVNHQKDIRAAVGIAPANYNIYVPQKTGEPIAWMQTTGLSDTTCPWVQGSSMTNGAKFIAIEHATNNGCDVPADIPIWKQGNHLCYDFEGCNPGYPTKVCTFNGGHTNIANDGGSNANWIAQESWDFFKQF